MSAEITPQTTPQAWQAHYQTSPGTYIQDTFLQYGHQCMQCQAWRNAEDNTLTKASLSATSTVFLAVAKLTDGFEPIEFDQAEKEAKEAYLFIGKSFNLH